MKPSPSLLKNSILALSLASNAILIPWLASRARHLDFLCRIQMVRAVELACEVGYWHGKGQVGQDNRRRSRLQVSELSSERLTVVIHPASGLKLEARFSDGRCSARLED
ncbi:hypothetical protein [Luteolibacter sp. Populi]|uniref:hypothetical protein n=1 Tax=Luteolibacter sp. Populi TaxID=3230487 RepID=UPI00346623AB